MMLIASLIFIDIIAISFVQMHGCHDIFIDKKGLEFSLNYLY